jgi:hypothetical protein
MRMRSVLNVPASSNARSAAVLLRVVKAALNSSRFRLDGDFGASASP